MSSEDSRDRQQTGKYAEGESASDLLPGYVLGILDSDEQLVVETALSTSAHMQNEYRSQLAVIDALNDDTDLVEPPSRLGERIRASVSQPAVQAPVPIRRRSRFPVALGAVAALLVAILAGVIVTLLGEVDERDDQIAALEMSVADRPQTDFSQPLVWSTIGAESEQSGAKGYFCRTEDGSVGWIIIEGMPMDDQHVLQLWLVDDDEMVTGGMIPTDPAGRGFGVVRLDVPVHTFSQIWITIEPPGGSPHPTTDPDLKAPIV